MSADSVVPGRSLRVAVVGAGPGGLYTAGALCMQKDVAVEVDVLDRLPAPFGLLRYGVAPDHLKMKSLATGLQKVLDDPRVRLFGDVRVGDNLSVAELRECYDAVVYAIGAATDRRLGIPGEDLPGSTSATAFVNWYSGHPDQTVSGVELDCSAAAVLGLGNVAVDVVRILIRSIDELRPTDMPDEVLDVLAASKVTDVHVIGRRGPADAKWTSKEFREICELTGVDVVVNPDDVELDEAAEAKVAGDKNLARSVALLKECAQRPLTGAPRRIHFHFFAPPTEILGADRVEGIRAGKGEHERTLEVGLVLRSVGYLGVELTGVPFDASTGTIPTDSGGRVLRDGAVSGGEYVAGWARRGPTGVIGTNRPDGELVSASLRADAAGLVLRPAPDPAALHDLLGSRGVPIVDLSGWAKIDAAEVARGAAQGRPRAKLSTYSQLRSAARAEV